MAIGRRGVVALAAVGAALGLGLVASGVTGVVVREATSSAARTALAQAGTEFEAATAARTAAIAGIRDALLSATDTREASAALLAVADPSLLADPALGDRLQQAIDELTTVAALLVRTDGTVMLPALPAASPASPRASPDTADEVLALAAPLSRDAIALRERTSAIEAASAALHRAALAVIASAHEKAAATPVPELASQETKDAVVATVTALERPTASADLAALVTTYRDAWAAAVASHEEAQRAVDRDALEPTYINGILVVNKTYALPSWYGDGLTGETLAAFDAMRSEAASLGLDLYISSGFRSYWSQESIYNRYVATDGQAAADRYSARPGHSEHQSGLTFDLNTIDEAFGSTAEGVWVRDNAHRFGFVVRYPPGKEAITGYIWEPWHLRYLGVPVATELYSSGLTLEEYLGVTSQYR